MLDVKLQRIHADAILPDRAYEDAAGFDLYAIEDKLLPPGAFQLIRTGLCIQLPPQTEAQVRPKSGLALQYGVTVLNAPGTIDADYRGEIGVVLINHGKADYLVRKGSKIAQMVFGTLCPASFCEVDALSPSLRGAQGYGSSGQFAQDSGK